MLKNSKNQCKKLFSLKHSMEGDISHGSKTANMTVFDPVICKTPDAVLFLRHELSRPYTMF